jgi:hypothetical protein
MSNDYFSDNDLFPNINDIFGAMAFNGDSDSVSVNITLVPFLDRMCS